MPVDAASRVRETAHPSYLWVLLAALASNMMAGSWGLVGVPVPVDRGLFVLGLVLLVLDRRAWWGVRVRITWVHLSAAALVMLAVGSALAHGTLATSYGFFALTDRLVLPFALLLFGGLMFRSRPQRDLLLKVLVVVGLYLGVTALAGAVGADALVFPRFISDPSVGIQFGRARGPFLASEAMGIVLVQCGFAAALLASRPHRVWRPVGVLVVALCSVGALLTLTRSIWLGAVVGVAAVFILDPRLRRWLPLAVATGVAATVLALTIVPGLAGAVYERAGTERSLDDRANTNEAALRIIAREPLTGVGWVRFLAEGSEYVRQADEYPITNTKIEVHNVALGRAAELGLPAAGLWVAVVLGGPVRGALGRPRTGTADEQGWRLVCLGSTSVWFVATLFSPVPYPMANNLAFLLAGIALSRTFLSQR